MSNPNLIKPKQIDSSLIDLIKEVASGDIANAILSYSNTGYHGDNVLYVSGGTQTILGQKTFNLSPNIPYTGNDSQPISKLYFSDQFTTLSALIASSALNTLHTTGNETALGIKTFSTVSSSLITGANVDFTSSALVPTVSLAGSPNTRSALNLSFFYNQGILFSTGFQSITDYKEFIYAPSIINQATGTYQAVRYSQLIDSGNWLQTQINALSIVSGNQISGFGGVTSWNGKSGNLYAFGRGGITVKQQGSIMLVSGNTPILSGSGVYLVQGEQGLMGLNLNPRGVWQTDNTYSYLDIANLSGTAYVSSTGHLSTVNNMPGTGGVLAPWYLLFSGGVAGPIGSVGGTGATGAWNYRGQYSSAIQYIFNDAVSLAGSTYGTSGASLNISPVTGSTWYVIAASGSIGSVGVTGGVGPTGGTGPTGPIGPAGLAFVWRGTWNAGTNYLSGNAVAHNGSSYGVETTSSGNIPSTGVPWFVLAASGTSQIVSGAARTSEVYTTVMLANNAYETGTATLGKTFILRQLSTDIPARVRAYSTKATRDADILRAIDVTPTGNHGLLFEFLTVSGLLDMYASPHIAGANNESAVSQNVPITIENKLGNSGIVNVTFGVTVLEG